MYVEKLETTFGNGQFHIKITILASFENLEEPAAVGPPPHMAAICCSQWRLSPFPGHVFLSLPQFLPLCRLSPSARIPAQPPCASYLLASAGIWIRNCLMISPNILYFNSSPRLRHCKPHSVAVPRISKYTGLRSWYQMHELHPGCTTFQL